MKFPLDRKMGQLKLPTQTLWYVFFLPLGCWNINFMINVWKEDGQSKSCTSAGSMVAVKCHNSSILSHFDPFVNIADGLIHSWFS